MTGPRKIGESTSGGGSLTPTQASNLNANTSARHTHSNKTILDGTQESFTTAILNNINNKVDIDGAKQLSTEDFTTAEKNKLGNLTDNFKGLFANAAARDAAIPAPASGNTVVQDDTNTVWFYDGAVWTDTGNTSTGDMLASLYDPQGISGDAFLRSNHTGAQSIATITGLQTALDSKANTASLGAASGLDVGVGAGQIPRNSDLALSGANFGKNLIINADFSINQEVVSGTVTLAAGAYGHDMFKAGAGGCTYTFSTSGGVTTITITTGSLLQIIEGQTLEAKPVVLSWEGTSQGRINAGAYGTSGAVTATLTGGANATVEFNTGTLSKPQLEFGNAVTAFEHVQPADQLARCQRYFERLTAPDAADQATLGAALGFGTTVIVSPFNWATTKRALPAITLTGTFTALDSSTTEIDCSASSIQDKGLTAARISSERDTGTHTAGDVFMMRIKQGSGNYIDIDARL